MLHHVSIGVTDVARAAQFYDAVLSILGFRRVMEVMPYGIAYGIKMPQFWVQLPHDQGAPSGGNGTHIAFNANTQAAVNAFHAAALAAGGRDEGAPGPRPEYTAKYYGAFVRDLDGNKIEAVFLPMGTTPETAKASKAKARKAKPAKRAAARKSGAKKSARPKAKKRARKRARRR
ncbi:MAG TPA: VOC family protein [Burkholderiales bacterium]|nr:VOC family protein [Burkholderiales bacterium]